MHISNAMIRTAREAVNSSDSLVDAISKCPFKKDKHVILWRRAVGDLWHIFRVLAPDTREDERLRLLCLTIKFRKHKEY